MPIVPISLLKFCSERPIPAHTGTCHNRGHRQWRKGLGVLRVNIPLRWPVGGGLDLNAGKHFALRLGEMDYVLTRYTNPFTQTNNQNNFRYLGGVVFKFGGE